MGQVVYSHTAVVRLPHGRLHAHLRGDPRDVAAPVDALVKANFETGFSLDSLNKG